MGDDRITRRDEPSRDEGERAHSRHSGGGSLPASGPDRREIDSLDIDSAGDFEHPESAAPIGPTSDARIRDLTGTPNERKEDE